MDLTQAKILLLEPRCAVEVTIPWASAPMYFFIPTAILQEGQAHLMPRVHPQHGWSEYLSQKPAVYVNI
jgi:hypothetical protein